MNANSKIVDPLRGLSRLVRPHYSPGLLLQDDDLAQAVDYTRELSRLLFRSLFGCGVVCGLEVKTDDDCGKLRIDIDKGVALDCHGDPVEVPSLQSIHIDPTCGPPIPKSMCIVLRRNDRCCAPRTAICADDGDEDEPTSVCTREREGFEIRVLTDCPKCSCGCHPASRMAMPEEAAAERANVGELIDAPLPAPAAPNLNVVKKKVGAKSVKVESQASTMMTLEGSAASPRRRDCQCVDPTHECYKDHYLGKCACDCCDDEWIVLARVVLGRGDKWGVDHSVRRFVRPVLMADPLTLPKPATS